MRLTLCLLLAIQSQASLTFVGATTDRVEVTQVAAINTLQTATVLVWVKVTTLTAARAIWGKTPDTLTQSRALLISGTGGDLQVAVRRAAALSYITSNTPLATGVWTCIAFTFDSALTSNTVHIYTGTLTTTLTEATYGTQTESSGNAVSDAANPMTFGNRLTSGPIYANALPGDIAIGMVWDRVLTLGELRQQQFRPRVTSGLVNYIQFGYGGTGTQADWSGGARNGTVTGATVTAHVPLPAPFSMKPFWRSPLEVAGGWIRDLLNA